MKVCPTLKFLTKPKICQKWFGVQSLGLLAANIRWFQVKKFSFETLVTLSEEAQSIWTNSDWRFGHTINWVWFSKNQKFVKNGSGWALWNFLQPILDRFKQRDFPQRHWSPFQKKHSSFEPIRKERSVIRSKSLSYTRIPQKAENLSKMVRGALFRAFCSQY